MIFKLAMVVSLLLSFGTAFADSNQQASQTSVQVLVYNQVKAGHSYRGQAVMTVRLKNGTSYVKHFDNIWIDYGFYTKAFGQGDQIKIKYNSKCEDLRWDATFQEIVANEFGGSNVEYILVEIAVKEL